MAADIIDLKDRMKNTVDKKTVAVKVQDLKEAYALISPLTNLPYVECEQENFFDQVLLYEMKEDAEAAAKVYGEKGIRVLVRSEDAGAGASGETRRTRWRETESISQSGSTASGYSSVHGSECSVL